MIGYEPILFLLAFFALILVKAYCSSPRNKGKRGEQHIQKILAELPEEEYTTFNDVILKTSHGTTQIDHIVVSRYGVFVIETKNYRGEIYGNDDRDKWKQIIKTDVIYQKKWWKAYTYITNNEFYNPVRQSLGHVAQVKRILADTPNINIISIVVFSNQADLSGVKTAQHVINSCQLLDCISSYNSPYISEHDLTHIRVQLYDKDVREQVSDEEHIFNVRHAQAYNESKMQNGICPRCGKTLVYKHGKYGNFYGCSGYPSCHFTTNC